MSLVTVASTVCIAASGSRFAKRTVTVPSPSPSIAASQPANTAARSSESGSEPSALGSMRPPKASGSEVSKRLTWLVKKV